MSIDQIIALGASLGSCLAAVATFLTVREIAKQRKAAYRPELAASRTRFEGKVDEAAKGAGFPLLKTLTSDGGAIQKDGTSSGRVNRSLVVPFANIGLGAAKDVTIVWDFPLAELVDELNKRSQRTLTPSYFTLENGIFSAKSDVFGQWASVWENQKKTTFDYLLPASIQREPLILELPHAYEVAVSALIFLAIKELDSSFPDVPDLRARIQYSDVGNDKHVSVFDIEFHLIVAHGSGEFQGYFEFKKVN